MQKIEAECAHCCIDKVMWGYLLKQLWKDNPDMLAFVKENIEKQKDVECKR